MSESERERNGLYSSGCLRGYPSCIHKFFRVNATTTTSCYSTASLGPLKIPIKIPSCSKFVLLDPGI